MEIVRNRQSTPESTQPQLTPPPAAAATAAQASRQNSPADCNLENVQETPTLNLRPCYADQAILSEVRLNRTALSNFLIHTEYGNPVTLTEAFELRNLFIYNALGVELPVGEQGHITTPIADHPFNLLVPGVVKALKNGEESYIAPRQKARAGYKSTSKQYGIEYFLNAPYFEPRNLYNLFPEGYNKYVLTTNITPVHFGPNSLRDSIADAVADKLEDLKQHRVEETEMPRPRWFYPKREQYRQEIKFYGEGQSTRFKDYIRTPLWASDEINWFIEGWNDGSTYNYSTPKVSWEFIHPTLPIVQVTTWNTTNLPLKQPGAENCTSLEFNKIRPQCGLTSYAVTFVVAFQNRWSRLDDPNRWVNQFQDQTDLFAEVFGGNPADYKDRWHHTDFTYYGLIGNVEIEVFASKVLNVGKHNVSINKTWPQSCGNDLFDDFIELEHFSEQNLIDAERRVTPGFPLPGEVLHSAENQPGTDAWDDFDQDGKLQDYLEGCKPSAR